MDIPKEVFKWFGIDPVELRKMHFIQICPPGRESKRTAVSECLRQRPAVAGFWRRFRQDPPAATAN